MSDRNSPVASFGPGQAGGPRLSRRVALKVAAAAGGGLMVGSPEARAAEPEAPDLARHDPGGPRHVFAHWLTVGTDDSITVAVHLAEMGQGIATALAQLLAEELDIEWSAVKISLPRNGPHYYNRGYGNLQESTGGSASIRGQFTMFREMGAVARELLKQAAAEHWSVPRDQLTTMSGRVYHARSGRSAGYGQLAATAAKLEAPATVALRPKSEWKLLGRALPRLDTPAKIDGSAKYGMDAAVPGALVATVVSCPAYSGRLAAVDPAPAMAVPGVTHVVPLGNAVAVVANGYWPARKGLDALRPAWDLGERGSYSDGTLNADFERALARDDAPILIDRGDAPGVLAKSANTISATYDAPYLAHVCMEPMNATVDVRADGVEIWMSAQSPTNAIEGVAKALDVDPANVRFNRMYLGGGFGRRGESDVAVQAALISKVVGQPVKLIWPREEDVRRDFFRPAAKLKFDVALNAEGLPDAVAVINACPSIAQRRFPTFVRDGKDMGNVSGFADMPYAVANFRLTNPLIENGVPVGYWRAVNHSQNVFFRESLIDELALVAGRDPLDYRRALVGDQPRFHRVFDALAEYALMHPLPQASTGVAYGRGFAFGNSHGSVCGQMVDVAVTGGDGLKIARVHCVIDVGTAVNPGIVATQMEGSIIDGLSFAMYGGLTLQDGGVLEANFDRIRLFKIDQIPEITVDVVEWPDVPVGGVGEPGLPPAAPALTAAIFRATGRRIRSLPIARQGFALAV